MDRPETIARWWNGSWGTMTRRDVWLEAWPDSSPHAGLIQVRWRGGDWRDRDGSWRTHDPAAALHTVDKMLDPALGGWKPLTVGPA